VCVAKKAALHSLALWKALAVQLTVLVIWAVVIHAALVLEALRSALALQLTVLTVWAVVVLTAVHTHWLVIFKLADLVLGARIVVAAWWCLMRKVFT
jgi:hypothetical protein